MAASCLKLETRRPPEEGIGARRSADVALNRCSRVTLNPTTPVNQKGCFEFDRILKCGTVQKRTRRTKAWKSVYLVLRANAVSLYKNDKENKLRHQIYLSDLSAVAYLKDPKGKRKNLFGLFSSSRNFHFEAPTAQDAREWVQLIRNEARLEEEEEEMILNGHGRRSISPIRGIVLPSSLGQILDNSDSHAVNPRSSSTENHSLFDPPQPNFMGRQRMSSTFESSGLSANEIPSHSDISDMEMHRAGAVSCENLAVQSPGDPGAIGPLPRQPTLPGQRPPTAGRAANQMDAAAAEQENERVIWHGWLWRLQSKGGVRQWKDMWAVLRGRSLVLYKDENEYTAQWITDVGDVVDVVDIDPLSKSKTHCLQIITEEKSYRFCAHDEDSLVHFIGALKSLLAKRRSLVGRNLADLGPL